MNPASPSMQFTDLESAEIVAYRPVNRVAILALVLGVLSAAALVHPLLLLLPLLGIAASVFAAKQLMRGDSTQAGRKAMQWGLFLSVLFGSCAATGIFYRQRHLDTVARQCGESWLDLFRQGKVREAHQLTLDDSYRAAPGRSLDEHYAVSKSSGGDEHGHTNIDMTDPTMAASAPPYVQLQEFLKKPTIVRLSQLGNRARISFQSTIRQDALSATQTYVQQQYVADYEENGQPQQLIVKLGLERTLQNRVASWKVMPID